MRRFTVLIAVFFIVLAGGLGVVSVASAQVQRNNNAVVLISIEHRTSRALLPRVFELKA